jgi:hypothetical protein
LVGLRFSLAQQQILTLDVLLEEFVVLHEIFFSVVVVVLVVV